MQLPEPGQMFLQRYHLQEVLGRGGFAAVYRAVDVEIGRDVAIKILTPEEEGYGSGVEARFLREGRLIGGFRDPHTITMFDFGRSSEGLLFMVFEYLAGRDLSVTLKESGALGPEVVAYILRQLLESLREAHAVGVLHRDVKPANVLVYDYMGDGNRVKLLDFGIATFVDGTSGGGGGLTQKGMVVGSPGYMAPERLLGMPVGPTSDLYSLGLVAHEMLVGEPAAGGSDKEVIRAQLSDVPVRVPKRLRTDEALCRVVDRLSARQPEKRFQSASDALDALAVVIVRQQAGGPEPVQDGGLSFRAILMAGLVAGGLVLVLLNSLSMVFKEAPPKPSPAPLLPAVTLPTARPVAEARTESPRPSVSDAGSRDVESQGQDVGQDMSPPASGCGDETPWTGKRTFQIERGLQMRSWLTYLPKGYQPNKKYPVVLALHPRMNNGAAVVHDLDLLKVADRRKFIVVAPNAGEDEMNWPASDGEFIRQAIVETSAVACVDSTQVYAIGTGIGADMLRTLPCELPLSAIALISSGQNTGDRVCPAVPVIRFQGDADPYLPIDGRPNCIGEQYLSLEESEEIWRDRNECSGKRRRRSSPKNGRCYEWSCEVDFVSCKLKGGNEFSTTKPRPFDFPGCSAAQIDYPVAETAWQFFRKSGRALSTD